MDAGERARLQSHYRGLYGFALTLARNDDEARDLVQETAARALGARRVPQDATAFRVWLFRILHNAWRDRLKRYDRRNGASLDDVDRTVRFDEWLVLHEHKINAMAVRAAIATLSPDHQRIIALIDIAGLKYSEAGEVLHIAQGTIMSRLARARHALLTAMSEAKVIPIDPPSRRTRA